MATETIERPEVDETTEDGTDIPKVFHYVKKDKIAESAVMGNHVVALRFFKHPHLKIGLILVNLNQHFAESPFAAVLNLGPQAFDLLGRAAGAQALLGHDLLNTFFCHNITPCAPHGAQNAHRSPAFAGHGARLYKPQAKRSAAAA